MLTYTPFALLVPVCSTLEMVGLVLFTGPGAIQTNHAWSASSSGNCSSTASSTTSVGSSVQVSVLVISPCGVGIIVSPLTIALSLGPPKPFLCQRCDA